MLKFILTFLSALVAAEIVGVNYTGLGALLIFTIILVIVNGIVKPVIKFFTWPINFLTLGLFYLFLNLGFLLLVSFLTPGFILASLQQAILFGLVLSILQWLLHKFDF